MIARTLAALVVLNLGAGSEALAGVPALPADAMSMVESVRRTPAVARCVGRDEYGCRVRVYCRWVKGYKRAKRPAVPSHCRMRRR